MARYGAQNGASGSRLHGTSRPLLKHNCLPKYWERVLSFYAAYVPCVICVRAPRPVSEHTYLGLVDISLPHQLPARVKLPTTFISPLASRLAPSICTAWRGR